MRKLVLSAIAVTTLLGLSATKPVAGQATAPAVRFSMQALRIDPPGARPDYSFRRPSLKTVRVGHTVQISLYVYFNRVRQRTAAREVEQVWRLGRVVFTSKQKDTLKRKDTGAQGWYSDIFTPRHVGQFRVTGSFLAAGVRKSISTSFRAVP